MRYPAALLALIFTTPAFADTLTFEQHVRPILKAYCLDCHGAHEKLSGKLDLRLKRFIVQGGKNGTAIVANDAAHSALIERMKAGEMPPTEKKVPADQIAIIEKWIATGAKTLKAEPTSLPPGLGITDLERAYWFYQPLTRPTVPATSAKDRVRTPIDAFILAKLREKQLGFNPDADRNTLIRRATLDLTGLPPTQEEIDAFVSDKSPTAYENLLDRLLASPAYGERWGRHWLDVVGYADSDGDGSADTARPNSWRYRDYVIRALNADMPFNQFIVEQLAGDELVPRPWNNLTPKQIDTLAATGFLRTAPDGTSSSNTKLDAEQVVADTLKIVTSALIGSSVGCAQCHDHRYDPISQRDYFQFRAIFEPTLDPAQWRQPSQRHTSLYTDAQRKKAVEVDAEAAKMQAELNKKTSEAVRTTFEKEIAKFPESERAKLKAAFDTPEAKRTPEQKKLVANNPKLIISPGVIYQYDTKLDEQIKAMAAKVAAKRAEKPVEEFVAVATELPGRIPATKLYYRGDARQPTGPDLSPCDLTIATPEGQRCEIPVNAKAKALPTTGRKLAYARHLTDGKHPLFGRVQANRIWLNHFGRGIVDTPGEFGRLGQLPTHPELLDWLATELPAQGWSLKKIHKIIMTSTVYRQSSQQQPMDSANLLYSRFPVRRLEAEVVRDRLLAVAGRLDRTPFGPVVPVVEDPTGQIIAPEDKPRRSVYLQSRRSKPVAFLTTFDAPAGELNCERRVSVTSAQQALALMNGDFVRTQAGHLAARVRTETPTDLPVNLPGTVRSAPTPDVWSYGYGAFDANSRRMSFKPLGHFTRTRWQGGKNLPDPKAGWAMLQATGGHPGDDVAHAAIRRWTAPRDGIVSITGDLRHPSAEGDGIRGRIVTSRNGLLNEWILKSRPTLTPVNYLTVKAGDTIDFVIDCYQNHTADTFTWTVLVKLDSEGNTESWDSFAGFRGPTVTLPQLVTRAWQLAYLRSPTESEVQLGTRFLETQMAALQGKAKDPELAALTNLCQQLLASNEFLYVD